MNNSLLPISVSHIATDTALQLEIPLQLDDQWRRPSTRKGTERWIAVRPIDAVRDRVGREMIGCGSVMLGDRRTVRDAFRKLAEAEP